MNSKQKRPQEAVLAEIVQQLRELVAVAHGNPSDFELRWEASVSAFLYWIRGLPAAISPLVRNLELLRNIEQEFHTQSLRRDESISNLLLHNVAKPGEKVTIRGQHWLIVSRAISDNYGVEFSLINEKGEMLRHEFFD